MYCTLAFDNSELSPCELERQVKQAAGGLQALGVAEGDVVALMLHNEPALVVAMLAVRELGAYFCLVNWHFRQDEVNFILVDSGAKVLIANINLIDQIAQGIPDSIPLQARLAVQPEPATRAAFRLGAAPLPLPAGFVGWQQWLGTQPARTEVVRAPRGAMVYTSGTTGKPKGVRRLPVPPAQQAEMAELAKGCYAEVFGIDEASRCLLSAPMYHSAPCSYAIVAATSDTWFRIEPRFDALQTLQIIERDRISHLYLVPTMYHRLLRLEAAQRMQHDLRSVQFVASTGAPCPPATKRQMIEWWGPVIHEAYASSETGYITAIGSEDALRKPGSAGRPIGKGQVRILDDAGDEVPTGSVGVIHVRQPAYPDFTYNHAEEARAKMERGGLVTVGDMGYFDGDGFLFICDRKSDMVISGGVNIYPAEIEAVIAGMPGVADCAVFGIPDDEFGESLLAAVQPVPGTVLDEAMLRAWLAPRLANFKVPRRYEFHASLPREDTGKIFKRKLREPHWAGRTRKV